MTKYRVDRVPFGTTIAPAGMNSIRYLGDSEMQARKVFRELAGGLCPWDRPDLRYTVSLFEWQGSHSAGHYILREERPRFLHHPQLDLVSRYAII